LVELGLYSDSEVDAAARRIAARLKEVDPGARGVLAEEMIQDGVEALLGVVRDPQLGLIVAVAAGGTLVELLREAVVLIPPFTMAEAAAKLEGTCLWRLLTGFRGRRYDIEALLNAVLLMGRLALSVPNLVSLEVNPLFICRQGVIAGDAKLVVAKEPSA
jgi:succinyl-CoA synthetase beta subunit